MRAATAAAAGGRNRTKTKSLPSLRDIIFNCDFFPLLKLVI